MERLYEVTLPANRLKHATDMLRYDNAYEITVIPVEGSQTRVRLKLCNLTPGRWNSFGVDIEKYLPISYTVTNKVYEGIGTMSAGFISGLRFFQKWLRTFPEDTFLVQD